VVDPYSIIMLTHDSLCHLVFLQPWNSKLFQLPNIKKGVSKVLPNFKLNAVRGQLEGP
jgi:hypothetical protein